MKIDPSKICFGLTEKIDRESLAIFLKLAGQENFAELLSERLSSKEIIEYVDGFMILLRKHLSEDEYHRLFLQDEHHHHNQKE